MEEFTKAFVAFILVVFMLFIIIIASTIMGGVAGWVVGGVFPEIMAHTKAWFGVDVTNFQFGAMIGFVGSFLRNSSSIKSNS